MRRFAPCEVLHGYACFLRFTTTFKMIDCRAGKFERAPQPFLAHTMTDLKQYNVVRLNNELAAQKMVDMYIQNHIESDRQSSWTPYIPDNQQSKSFYIDFASRYLEPMLFSSGYWPDVKYNIRNGIVYEHVTMTTMTPEERIANGIDTPLNLNEK